MFCANCGQELRDDANFCFKCGLDQTATANANPQRAASAESSPPSSRKARKGKGLWKIHTFDWEGECPTCGLPHTSDTARCPNDGSPLVVAFDVPNKELFAFPVRSAEVCCLEDCGFKSDAITCNRDGTIIKSKNLSFTLPLWRAVVHNAINLSVFLVLVALLGTVGFLRWKASSEGDLSETEQTVFNFSFVGVLFVLGFLVTSVRTLWWPFRRTFDFEEAKRTSR